MLLSRRVLSTVACLQGVKSICIKLTSARSPKFYTRLVTAARPTSRRRSLWTSLCLSQNHKMPHFLCLSSPHPSLLAAKPLPTIGAHCPYLQSSTLEDYQNIKWLLHSMTIPACPEPPRTCDTPLSIVIQASIGFQLFVRQTHFSSA